MCSLFPPIDTISDIFKKNDMKKLPIGFFIPCLSFLLFACPTPVDPPLPSSNAGIAQVMVGEEVLRDNGQGQFSLELSTGVTEVVLTITTEDDKASTRVTRAGVALVPEAPNTFLLSTLAVGLNSYVITVEAEDTISSRNYPLALTRAAPPPIILPEAIVLLEPADSAEGLGAIPVFKWERSQGAYYWKVYLAPGTSPSDEAVSDPYYLTRPEWVPEEQLEPNQNYAWKVEPYDFYGRLLAPASETWTFVTGQLPLAPASLTVVPVEGKPHLTLQWDLSLGAQGYRIYRNGVSTPVCMIPSGETVSWTDGAPNAGVNTYTIRSFNSFGNSLAAAEAMGTPSAGGSVVIIFK